MKPRSAVFSQATFSFPSFPSLVTDRSITLYFKIQGFKWEISFTVFFWGNFSVNFRVLLLPSTTFFALGNGVGDNTASQTWAKIQSWCLITGTGKHSDSAWAVYCLFMTSAVKLVIFSQDWCMFLYFWQAEDLWFRNNV